MLSIRAGQDQRFINMVANLQKVSSLHHLVMNDQLQVVDKRGCKWMLLCLLKPFCCLFGKDIYSHYRVNNVANAIFKACGANKGLLQRQPELVTKIQTAVTALNMKSKDKYKTCLQTLKDSITKLTAPKVQQPLPQVKTTHFVPSVVVKGSTPTGAQNSSALPHPETLLSLLQDAPHPVSVVPQSHIKHSAPPAAPTQFDPAHFQMKWPPFDDLEACGVTPEQTAKLKAALDELVPQCLGASQYKLNFVKTEQKERKLQVLTKEGLLVKEIATPLSLEVVYHDGQLQDIVLLTKYIVAKGGETKVRLCFSLFQGLQFVRKNCFGGLQRQLLEYFRDHPSDGIVKIKGIRESQSNGSVKVQSIEDFWLANLREFITFQKMPTFENRLSIARDMLSGIAAIHNIECDQYVRDDGSKVGPFKMFHLDITPSNILLNPSTENPSQGAITDFGCAHPENVGGTAGFKAPEQILLCHKYKEMTMEEIIAYNLKFGQASDVWSTGLVLSVLLTWAVDPLGGPPLPCIADSLKKAAENEERLTMQQFASTPLGHSMKPGNPLTFDKNITLLQQKEIDEDLSKLRAQCISQVQGSVKKTAAMSKAWDVIGQMVQTDPAKRISSEKAMTLLKAIKL